MSSNKAIVERYLTTSDKSAVGDLLTDDFEWVEWGDGVPSTGLVTRGKAAHLRNYGSDGLQGSVTRLTEENDVVVAEGIVQVTKADGGRLSVRYVNIFEMTGGKIRRKSSFGALLKDAP